MTHHDQGLTRDQDKDREKDQAKDRDLPECFGNLEKVFPMTGTGLRETPEDCFFHCPVKTRCLKQAMATKDGIQVEEEIIERGSKAGAMTFLERWSRKKQAHRRQKKFKD